MEWLGVIDMTVSLFVSLYLIWQIGTIVRRAGLSTFLGFFDLQLMEDNKDGKEEVLDEVVMEHIK